MISVSSPEPPGGRPAGWVPVMQGWLFRRPDGCYIARIDCAGSIQETEITPDKASRIMSVLTSFARQLAREQDMVYSDEELARVTHEANRALQAIHGDEVPSQPWDCEGPEARASIIAGVRNARHGMTPEQLHESWMADKLARGWRYGTEKNPERRTHPCLVPYRELPEYQKDKDKLFSAIVTALSTFAVDRAGAA